MRFLKSLAVALGLLLAPVTAFAADNVLITPCASGCVTMRTQDVGSGVESAYVILGDTSGAAVGTTGSPLFVTVGSGKIVSGAIASGAIASGAVASGAYASGALASGSIASGAMVDFLTTRGTKAPGTAAANSLLNGAVYTSAGITLTDGQQAALQFDSTGHLLVVGLGAAQGATTSGLTLSPVGCSVTTSAPSYTTAQTNLLSCDTPGNLRSALASIQVALPAWGHVATGAAPPAGSTYVSALGSGATGGLAAGLIQCDQKAIYDASTSGSTELQALTSGRTIYVCGYELFAGGTVNVKLIYGTGIACATGSNNLTPAYQLTAQVGLVSRSAFYQGMKTASANALCINASAGVAAQAVVYYAII